tara:strand:- start:297 stop:491 length:195 start_codon:yes stop_codon:yes gene_type:complete
MLMTQTEINNLFGQVNSAFKEQGEQLKDLKQQLDQLKERVDAQEKGPKADPSRRKRVQQAEKDS